MSFNDRYLRQANAALIIATLLIAFFLVPGMAAASMEPASGASRAAMQVDRTVRIQVLGAVDGRGGNAAPVNPGQDVDFIITVNGAPNGQSTVKESILLDNVPQHMFFVSASAVPGASGGFDGNRITWDGVTFTEGGQVVVMVRTRVAADAPCNSVLTSVAHVSGIGSDQAQVRVQCGPAPAPTGLPTVAVPSSPPPPPLLIGKTGQFEGQPLSVVDARHLGKQITYNIIVRRSGDVSGRVVRIVEDMGAMCGSLLGLRNPDGTLNPQNVEITSDFGHVGTQITAGENCTITILGDAKAIVGNTFHIKVRLRPTLAVASTAPTLLNRVEATLTQFPETPSQPAPTTPGALGSGTVPAPQTPVESVSTSLTIALSPDVLTAPPTNPTVVTPAPITAAAAPPPQSQAPAASPDSGAAAQAPETAAAPGGGASGGAAATGSAGGGSASPGTGSQATVGAAAGASGEEAGAAAIAPERVPVTVAAASGTLPAAVSAAGPSALPQTGDAPYPYAPLLAVALSLLGAGLALRNTRN